MRDTAAAVSFVAVAVTAAAADHRACPHGPETIWRWTRGTVNVVDVAAGETLIKAAHRKGL